MIARVSAYLSVCTQPRAYLELTNTLYVSGVYGTMPSKFTQLWNLSRTETNISTFSILWLILRLDSILSPVCDPVFCFSFNLAQQSVSLWFYFNLIFEPGSPSWAVNVFPQTNTDGLIFGVDPYPFAISRCNHLSFNIYHPLFVCVILHMRYILFAPLI